MQGKPIEKKKKKETTRTSRTQLSSSFRRNFALFVAFNEPATHRCSCNNVFSELQPRIAYGNIFCFLSFFSSFTQDLKFSFIVHYSRKIWLVTKE
ncbi:hypothetical protein ANTQUA_LOCUS2132 [Anthophora quadrimaculata]